MPLHADGAQRPVERWFKSSSGRGGRQFGSTGGDASLASRLVDQKVTTRDFPIRSIYRLTAQKPANHVEGEIGVWNTDSGGCRRYSCTWLGLSFTIREFWQ